MLVSREELRFDFNGARFDLQIPAERKWLGWIFNQFLYGEITGIQCGHWLFRAPHLGAATFLARQASEELAHFRKFLRILSLLNEKPAAAHWAVKFLATGMMGGTWGEHVALEMALGEGLVLTVFYAMADTIGDPEIQKILHTSALEEERHVEFGERETREWIRSYPSSKRLLLGLAYVQLLVLKRLRSGVIQRVNRSLHSEHPVMKQFDLFFDHTVRSFELRIDRLGLSSKPIGQFSLVTRLELVLLIPIRMIYARLFTRTPVLTKAYLTDPSLRLEAERFVASQSTLE